VRIARVMRGQVVHGRVNRMVNNRRRGAVDGLGDLLIVRFGLQVRGMAGMAWLSLGTGQTARSWSAGNTLATLRTGRTHGTDVSWLSVETVGSSRTRWAGNADRSGCAGFADFSRLTFGALFAVSASGSGDARRALRAGNTLRSLVTRFASLSNGSLRSRLAGNAWKRRRYF